MKSHLITNSLLTFLLANTIQPVLASPEQWRIDPDTSTISFITKNMGLPVKGKFTKIAGNVLYDDKKLSDASVAASVDVASIDTGIGMRDNHLKTKDFFDVNKFTEARFRSTKIVTESSGAFKIIGTLSMHGISKEISLTAQPLGNPKVGADGKSHLIALASADLYRKDFGIGGFTAATVGNNVDVQLQMDLIKD